MYGYQRVNVPKTPLPSPALDMLRAKGFGVEADGDSYIIAGAIRFWPTAKFWKTTDGKRQGYSLDDLIGALGPVGKLAEVNFGT